VELRRLPGETEWFVYQEGTFAPDDGNHRFLGGIAMDGTGNIGMAYSVVGEDKFPSLALTGRRAGDPLGEMTIQEFEFMPGAGSVVGVNRFGDYSTMRVDPVDDQSFWFTSEYGLANTLWATRIAGFVIRRDTVDMASTALTAPTDSEFLGTDETIKAVFTNAGLVDQQLFQVGYVLDQGAVVTEDLDVLLAPGDSYEHTFTQTGDFSAFGLHEIELFVNLDGDTNPFNDTLRRVIERIPRRDLYLQKFDGLNAMDCKDTVLVDIRFANLGLDTLFEAKLNWQINDGPVTTIPWTQMLVPNGQSPLTEVAIYGFEQGLNEVKFYTSDPNGLDDQVTFNDTLVRSIEVSLDLEPVLLTVKFDFFPEETSWELRSEDGTLVGAGGPYEGFGSFSQVREEFCLDPEGCYVFTIFDAAGDGITLVPGYYSITDGAGNVLAYLLNPAFGSEESHSFCATFACNVVATANVVGVTTTGANDGSILISPVSGGGAFQYSLDGQNFQQSNVFENLGVGDYTVTVMDANGCTAEVTATVGLGTAVDQVALDYAIELFPNPTEELFRLNVTGLSDLQFLNFQILDAAGKTIQYKRLQRYNAVLTAQLSLRAFPSGMYFIKFDDPR
ncbi:MAG: T9SS type A sorting domain-containing protein, partial [Phaeodactylibacter sp.]|nr:T9SS type A sorting domain-containing protein [Phaeodactylibacter sp.]